MPIFSVMVDDEGPEAQSQAVGISEENTADDAAWNDKQKPGIPVLQDLDDAG